MNCKCSRDVRVFETLTANDRQTGAKKISRPSQNEARSTKCTDVQQKTFALSLALSLAAFLAAWKRGCELIVSNTATTFDNLNVTEIQAIFI